MVLYCLRYSSLIFILILISIKSLAQISAGGIPPGFEQSWKDHEITSYHVAAPDTEELLKEDAQAGKYGVAERIGVILPVQFSPSGNANWRMLPDGTRQWRIRIVSEAAKSLALYYENFNLPVGCSLYLYNDSRTKLIGAFTHKNNHESKLFATELIPGDALIVELLVNKHLTEYPDFVITDILYAYKTDGAVKSFGASGACNVNINCSEGNNWRDQKKGVVKIYGRVGGSANLCSGSLVNNTSYDFQPYVFTADHCARTGSAYASESDFNQWIFYFNYEAGNCPNPTQEPGAVTLTGSALKANTGGGSANMGSDFCLVLLNNNVPPSVMPYFNGWSRINSPSLSGASIHHPRGDIKKISTYTEPLLTASWAANTPNMYWQVRWSQTANGHGVTEGGSSGSPIFNSEGFIVGQLTGGQSSCGALLAPDYYGKFSHSWESNGTTPERQLKPWLDPENLGDETLEGAYDTLQVIARFVADTTFIQTGTGIRFSDLSLGEPTQWRWIFQGGEPAESFQKDPGKITYNRFGEFDVTLIVKNENRSDSLVRKKYVRTIPGMFPNPAQDKVTLLLGSHGLNTVTVEIYDMHGILYYTHDFNISNLYSLTLPTGFLKQGPYILNLTNNEQTVSRSKLLIAR